MAIPSTKSDGRSLEIREGGAARASTFASPRESVSGGVHGHGLAFVSLLKEWKMLGVPSRRLSRHLSPPLPFNVASNRGMKRKGWWKGTEGRERRTYLLEAAGRKSTRRGWLAVVIRAWRTVRVDRRGWRCWGPSQKEREKKRERESLVYWRTVKIGWWN